MPPNLSDSRVGPASNLAQPATMTEANIKTNNEFFDTVNTSCWDKGLPALDQSVCLTWVVSCSDAWREPDEEPVRWLPRSRARAASQRLHWQQAWHFCFRTTERLPAVQDMMESTKARSRLPVVRRDFAAGHQLASRNKS